MRPSSSIGTVLAATLAGACPALPPAQPEQPADAAPPHIRWIEDQDKLVELQLDGRTLWRFNLDPAGPHNYFHPLRLPGLGDLTLDAPGDHVHHHGLWFSWKYINGENFWEHAPGGDRPAGQTAWAKPGIVRADDASAAFRLDIRYICGHEVVLSELREITVSAPGTDGSYAIDWASCLTALSDQVSLDRTPPPDEPGGQVYGGYAGLSARLVQMEDRQAMTTDGAVEFNDQDRYRGRHDAFEYSGTIDGKEVGIAILSHPENVSSPSPWYAIRSGVMSFMSPAVLCYEPRTLHRGEQVQLRYRVVVHPGRWSDGDLAAAFGEFVDETAEKVGGSEEQTDE